MWFTENPWPPVVILIVAAAVFVGLWMSQRRAFWLLAALTAVVGTFAVYFIERRIVTESEQIEQNVFDMTSAFRQRDEAKTLSYFSKQAPELHDLIRAGMKLVEVHDDLSVKDMSVRLLGGNTQAISHFRANATVTLTSGSSILGSLTHHGVSRWELRWQKEGDDWKVVEVVRLNPTKEERMPPLELRQQ
jgi:hypothetical protein